MNQRRITLPDRDDMLRRLRKVSTQEAFETCFYPYIVQEAGAQRDASGIVMILQLAFMEFLKRQPKVVAAALLMRTEEYVRALVDDKKVQKEALAHVAEMKRAMFR